MADDEEPEEPGGQIAEREERIDYWVKTGMGMSIRLAVANLYNVGIPWQDLDAIVESMAATVAACESIEATERPLAFLYQRAMEVQTNGGFQIDHTPICRMPMMDILTSSASGYNPARDYDRARSIGVIGGVDPDAIEILRDGVGDDDDDVYALDEAWSDFEMNAVIVDQFGIGWSVWQNDDIFLVPPYMEWDDGEESYVCHPGGVADAYIGNTWRNRPDAPVTFGEQLAMLMLGLKRDRMKKVAIFLDDSTHMGELVNKLNIVPFTMTYDFEKQELVWEGDPHAEPRAKGETLLTFAGKRSRLR